MTYAFIQDVPANAEIYAMIRAKLGSTTPAGLITHVVITRDAGLRYVDVWETEDAWIQFRDEQVEPAVTEVLAGFGIPHDHSMVATEQVEVIDVWLGEPAAKVG
ncbi:MAG: hypothetical protein ACXWBO_00815 [Ilumatobacteraceae bacterium]